MNRRLIPLTSAVMLLAFFSPTTPAHAVSAGTKCPIAGTILKSGSSRFECQQNSKTNTTSWVKLIKPSAFNCTTAKKTLPIVLDSYSTISTYVETVKSTYPPTDPFYIQTMKDFAKATSDLNTLKLGVKRYC